MKEFKYLGYVIRYNGNQEVHIRDRVRKGAALLGQVWGVGKRKFGRDWGRRIWLFDSLVWTVISYGVEIWGWKERSGIEKIQDRFLRWVLGVERMMGGYLVREELQREMLKGRAGLRAWGYEMRLEEGKGGELARGCWNEMRKRAREGKSMEGWEEERKEFFEMRNWSVKMVENLREEERMRKEEIWEREGRLQREKRWEEIRNSKSNRWYQRVKGDGIPGYLKKGWGESRWQRIARFRLGNDIRGERYWEEEEKRKCRMCWRHGSIFWKNVW